jgi:hypothetical protein
LDTVVVVREGLDEENNLGEEDDDDFSDTSLEYGY